MASNLSKIKPKLRTSGAITGNFGKSKPKAGSPLTELGQTSAEVVRVTKREEYIKRMVTLLNGPDVKMSQFAYEELHRMNCFMETRIAK